MVSTVSSNEKSFFFKTSPTLSCTNKFNKEMAYLLLHLSTDPRHCSFFPPASKESRGRGVGDFGLKKCLFLFRV